MALWPILACHLTLSIPADSPHIRDMAKSPEKKSPAADDSMPYRKRGNPMTDYADAAVPLDRGGFGEAPQAEFSGTPLSGSISDWAEQIEKEAEKQSKPKPSKKIPERSSAPTKTARGTSMGGAASRQGARRGRPQPRRRPRHLAGRCRFPGQFRRHRHGRGAFRADRERQPAAQERRAVGAAPPRPTGKIRRRRRHQDGLRFRARRRPAAGDQGPRRQASTRRSAPRSCSASPAPEKPSPWPR